MKEVDNKTEVKIRFLIEKLELLTGYKVTLEEVRRKPVASINDTLSVVKNLIKKNDLKNIVKIFRNGNVIRLEDLRGKSSNFAFKSVGYGLQEEGFRKDKVVKVNNKSYQKYIDATNRFIVLLPY